MTRDRLAGLAGAQYTCPPWIFNHRLYEWSTFTDSAVS